MRPKKPTPSNWHVPLNRSCDWEDPYNEPSNGKDSSNASYHDDHSDDDSTDYKAKQELLDDIIPKGFALVMNGSSVESH